MEFLTDTELLRRAVSTMAEQDAEELARVFAQYPEIRKEFLKVIRLRALAQEERDHDLLAHAQKLEDELREKLGISP